jgi:hypothetical protein
VVICTNLNLLEVLNRKKLYCPRIGQHTVAFEEFKIERLRYPGLRVRVSSFCLSTFADVSIFTRNFYPFSRGKPWSTRKRQTGTGVFCLLFVGRLIK